MTLVSVKNLSFYYDREKVLNEVNFEVNPGEFVILTGENGAAKSTLLKNILGRVQEFVESGRYPKGRWFKRLDAHDKEHVDRALSAVGMSHLRHKKIGELSGGQKQRICLARVFATDPDFFVLDEPTTGMDIESRRAFYRLLRHACKHHGKSILMVTHADQEIEGFYTREIRLVREEGTPWRCFSLTSSNAHS